MFGFGQESRPPMRRCRVWIRNVPGSRFWHGGGKTVYYNIVVDRCASLIHVRERGRREVATMDLPSLAWLVMEQHYKAKAREEQQERKRRRLVRRGYFALGDWAGVDVGT